MTEELRKLVDLLEQKLQEQQNQLDNLNLTNNRSPLFSVIQSLKSDKNNISTINLDEISNVSGKDSELERLIIEINDLIILSKEFSDGNEELELTESESKMIDEFVDKLENIDKRLLVQNRDKSSLIENQKISLSKIYDKLRLTGTETELINETEINTILGLISNQSLDFKKSILETILNINKKIAKTKTNTTKKIQNPTQLPVSKKATLIDENLLASTFTKYGYSINDIKALCPRVYENIRMLKLTDIENSFIMLSKYPQYNFLKSYGTVALSKGNMPSASHNAIKTDVFAKARVLYLLLRYSDDTILNYLANEASSRNKSLETLINIPGILKHVKKNKTDKRTPGGSGGNGGSLGNYEGGFENYQANAAFFDQNGYFDLIWKKNPSILTDNPESIVLSFSQITKYGLDPKNQELATSAVNSPNLIENIDLFIEEGLYDYVSKSLSQLKRNREFTKTMCYRIENLNLDKTKINVTGRYPETTSAKGWLKPPATYTQNLDNFAIQFELSHPDLLYYIENNDLLVPNLYKPNNSFIIEAFSEYEISNPQRKEDIYSYVINGVRVSKNKVLRLANIIESYIHEKENQEGKGFNLSKEEVEDLILYIATYKSYMNNERFDNIKNTLIKSRKMGTV